MQNKMRRGVSDTSRIADSIKPSLGVYGKSPFPPFDSYPQTESSVITPTKFAESGMGTAKSTTNQLRRGVSNDAMGDLSIKRPSSSNAKTSKNKYRSGRTMKNMKDKV